MFACFSLSLSLSLYIYIYDYMMGRHTQLQQNTYIFWKSSRICGQIQAKAKAREKTRCMEVAEGQVGG